MSLFLVVLLIDSPVNWPSWRGPDGTGSTESNLPIHFDEDTHVAWRTDLEGRGHSSPIVWGDLIYLTSAAVADQPVSEDARQDIADKGKERAKPQVSEYALDFNLWAIQRQTGQVAWKKALIRAIPHETTHGDASWASASCVTDGTRLVTSFGSTGIFCTDMAGSVIWHVDLGDMRTRRGFGEGSSPVLAGDSVIVNWDHEDQSFIAALDLETGEERWRQDREEPTSWATPLLVANAGTKQIIVPGTGASRGYDANTGKEVWSLSGMTLNAIPSPIHHNGLVYLMSGFRGNALQAIRLQGASGNLQDSGSIVWQYDQDTSYVPSAVLHRGLIYFLKHNKGILTCLDAANGQRVYGPVRLENIDGVYASLVAAGDHIYVVGRDGQIAVVQHGRRFKQVATNVLADRFDASPAISGNTLLLRGHQRLYAISQ